LSESLKIILVEDTLTQAMLFQHMLSKRGFEVELARSGKQALEKLASGKPDAVLTDINMPEMSGYELCRAIKDNDTTSGVMVILLTSTLHPDAIVNCINSGADDILLKGLNEDTFADLLKRSIGRKVAAEEGNGVLAKIGARVSVAGEDVSVKCQPEQLLRLLFSMYDLARSAREN
jgi:Response regulator containing a CheY-like receiver domain and a GGDEF domain